MLSVLQKILFAILLLLPGAASASSLCTNDSVAHERAVDYFYLQAISLMEQEKYDAAYEMFEHCRSLSPSSSAVLFELANIYQYIGQRDEALAILRKIVQETPQNYLFWESLLRFFEEEGNSDALLQVYEEMSRVFPEKSELYLTLAMQYSDKGDFQQAINALNRYEKIEGRSDIVSLQRYRIFLMMSDGEAAVAEAESLIAEFPDDPRFVPLLGETYYFLNDSEKSLSIHNGVLAGDPENIYSLKCLAGYYKAEKNDYLYCHYVERVIRNDKLDSEERLSFLKEYVLYKDLQGGSAYVISFLASLLELPHAYADATKIFFLYNDYYINKHDVNEQMMRPIVEKILQKEPDNSWAHITLLLFAVERQNYEEVVTRSETAIMYFPEILTLYRYRGISLYNLGHKAEALETYRQGVERCGDSADAAQLSDMYALIGDACHEAGNFEEAMKAYDSALAYDGSNLVVLNNYAYYLALENIELEKALEMSARTLQDEPDELIYVDTYAWILFLLERYDEAKVYADKLMAGDNTKSAVEYHHCGDIYAKCGDIDRAVECWILARDNGDDSKILKRKIKKRKYISDGKKK